jgi:hypothetical protein
VIADQALAHVTKAGSGSELAATLAVENRHHARLRDSASVATHVRRIAPRAQVEKRPQAVGLDRGERYERCFGPEKILRWRFAMHPISTLFIHL